MRAAIIGALVVGVMAYAPAQNARLRSTEASQDCPQPGAKVDLAFIIDRSGSLDVKAQGQTYNVEIEGVRRAILDPSLIPRDGSIAVSVFTFAGGPSLRVPFTEIKSEADAVAVAAAVEALKCVSAETCPLEGPNPGTFAAPALLAANQHLSDNQRASARRVLLMSTDGGFTDPDFAETASRQIRAVNAEIVSELDVILLGLFPTEDANAGLCALDLAVMNKAKANTSRIVYPDPEDNELPGARLDIKLGACNCPNAVFGSDCDRQVKDFVELIRRVLRSQPATRFLTVNTDADTDPGTPVSGGTLSLRQAIERANGTGGATTITFDAGLKTIRPRVPLPALIAPDIIICGCNSLNCSFLIKDAPACDQFLTIDGSLTDTTKGEQHSDGILICSDRDIVRGLRIINFPGAGVSIKPVCNRGFNRIESNRFEDNKEAGVRVLDSPADPDSDGAVRHNIGNTISMNDILGSETPIDLAGDGPTPNDPGDLDEGPNTLLNFPDNLSVADTLDVSATASGVTLTGQVNGPTAAGATVEIFAITSFRPVPGGRVIDGVTFLKQAITNADGTFIVTELPDSPTCGYTATVTDLEGNTSELMFPCGGFPRAKVTNANFNVAVPNQQSPQEGTFTIENTGCAPLSVSFASIIRDGFSRRRGNDKDRFSIPSVGIGPAGRTTTIEAGRFQQFTALFNPTIPFAVPAGAANFSSLVLPETTRSTVSLNHNGCSVSDKTISLIGRVNSQVQLIDPKNPQNPDAVVTLERSGDLFKVMFSLYDSNPQDIDSVTYQFLDGAGNTVPLEQPLRDLSKVIQAAPLNPGQSFFVVQEFSNAKRNRRVVSVLVTVMDKKGGKDSASGSLSSLTGAVSIQALLAPGKELVLPVVKLTPGLDRNGSPLRYLSSPKTQSFAAVAPNAGARKEKQQ